MEKYPKEEPDYINFEDLRNTLEIKDPSLFQIYLKELHRDLSERAESNRKVGVSRITFWEYMKIPTFISEKLFNALDKDNDTFLNLKEFSEGLFKLYTGSFEETAEIIFNVFDFNKDGQIEAADSKILLSYLPLKSECLEGNYKIQYKLQMESLDEIEDITRQTFGLSDKLNFTEFSTVIMNKKSDLFLQMICFLYLNKPFNETNIETYQSYQKLNSKSQNIISSVILSGSSSNSSPSKSTRLPSPRKSHLQPAETLLQLNLESISGQNSEDEIDFECEEGIKINLPKVKQKSLILDKTDKTNELMLVRLDNTRLVKNQPQEEATDIKEIIKNSKGILNSPTSYFRKKNEKSISQFNLEDNLIKLESTEDDNSASHSPTSKKSPLKRSLTKIKPEISYENWVYKLTENNKLKKYYLVIVGKDIYYYKSDTKEELLGMHNLSGCYVKENTERKLEGKKFFCFSLIFSSKQRNYFILNKNDLISWIQNLKKAIGYLSFFDYYDIIGDLGEGKFGMVKLGLHKNTNEKVAIKIIKKDSMSVNDMELVRTEIDIMKLCKHPNVIRLLDHFENSEFIFIVMEYLSGGDLGEFLSKNKFSFDETQASRIMSQIANGIKYIHKFGIVHRDLKPENIMLSGCKDDESLRIMDFGLSKILGPLEKACDGFGTLTFVAPEVLIRQPYNKQIDIWSIGVILYYMLSGILPFDDESDNEEIIAKKIVFIDVEFPVKYFKGRSELVLDIISKCLIKDPNKRITIENFLQHEWIKKHHSIK